MESIRVMWTFGYRQILRNRWFWLSTLMVPLVLGVIFLINVAATLRSVRPGKPLRVGLDPKLGNTGVEALRHAVREERTFPVHVQLYDTQAHMWRALRRGEIDLLITVAARSKTDGAPLRFRVYARPGKDADWVQRALNRTLQSMRTFLVLHRAGVPEDAIDVAMRRVSVEWQRVHAGRAAPRWKGYAVPMILTFIFFYPTVLAGSIASYEISAEKENRLYEILLSTARHTQIMTAKILTGISATLTQMAIWFVLAGIGIVAYLHSVHLWQPVRMAWEAIRNMLNLPTAWPIWLGILLLFGVIKMVLFVTLIVGATSLGRDYRDAQYVIGPIVMIMILPIMLLQAILQQPDHPLIILGLLFPLTTPDIATALYAGQYISTVAALAWLLWSIVWTVIAIRVSAKIFRFGLLLYSGRPSWRQIWWVIRST